jgi:hypothetical protein
MPAFVYNASFSTTCPRKPHSIYNPSDVFEFPERRFERNEAEVKHRDLQGDFQKPQPTRYIIKMTARSDALAFREGMSSSATKMRSSRNARNREDPVRRLQRFMYCEISLKQLFTVDLPCSECSPQIKDHIQVDERHL